MLYKTNNPHGGNIYDKNIRLDYSANINPLGTPQGIREAITDTLQCLHLYPDPYCRELIKAISEFEEISEDYIFCGNGATELIYAYCDAVKPKLAVETAPTFSEYSLALERVGCRVERYLLDKSTEFVLDEDFLEYIECKKPEVIFLCNPNNPTGRLISFSLLEKILKYCGENNIRLFVDECFLDLSDDGISMKGYIEKYPQLFILKAFTKSYGMAGLRLGYCLTSDCELLQKMSRLVQPWNVSTVAQAAGIAALKEQEFLQSTKKLIVSERQWLKENLEKMGFWVCPSKVNYLLLHGLSDLDKKLKRYGIDIRSCSNFYGLSDGWYRIAVRRREENEVLIDTIKSICEKR